MWRTLRLVASAALVGVVPASACAQLLRGRVLERDGAAPVADVVVTVYDSAGIATAAVRTRADGAFTLRSPVGLVQLHARRLGYAPKSTPWLEVEAHDTIAVELDVDRATIVLTPQLIEAERREIVETRLSLGMDPRSIMGNIISPSMVAQGSMGARNYLDVLAVQPAPWVRGSELCMVYVRDAGRGNACLSVYVDGLMIAPGQDRDRLEMARESISPTDIDYIVLLRPDEAGVLFGTNATNGVVLIYTKHGEAAARAHRKPD